MALVPGYPEQLQELNIKLHVDRISSLPDELLINILNFLPTKYAFVTTILSKKWSHLFKEVNNLDFDDSLLFNNCVHEKSCGYLNQGNRCVLFRTFICNMLDSIKLSNLVRFRIKLAKSFSWSFCNFSRPWLDTILNPSILIADLYIEVHSTLPKSVFLCKTLCILKLNTFSLNIPDTVCLPCLKILHVEQNNCLDADAIGRIFSGCPVLDDVYMKPLTWYGDGARELYISGSSLTILKLQNRERYYSGMPRHLLAIDAPLLQCFHYVGNLAKSHSINTSDCLVEAHLDIFIDTWDYFMDDSEISHSARVLIQGVSSMKSLFLSTHCAEALTWIDDKLPILRNLNKLELDCCTNLHDTLLRLLESAPCLEKLILPKGLFPVECKDKDTKGQDNWGRNQIVPSCMKTHLKVIEIEHFLGLNEELKIVVYFLSNSYNLTQLIIHKWLGKKSKFRARKQLKRLGRRRKNCVHFSELYL